MCKNKNKEKKYSVCMVCSLQSAWSAFWGDRLAKMADSVLCLENTPNKRTAYRLTDFLIVGTALVVMENIFTFVLSDLILLQSHYITILTIDSSHLLMLWRYSLPMVLGQCRLCLKRLSSVKHQAHNNFPHGMYVPDSSPQREDTFL